METPVEMGEGAVTVDNTVYFKDFFLLHEDIKNGKLQKFQKIVKFALGLIEKGEDVLAFVNKYRNEFIPMMMLVSAITMMGYVGVFIKNNPEALLADEVVIRWVLPKVDAVLDKLL